MTEDTAFRELIAPHAGMLWRVAGSYEADPELRKELHQEILVAAWRALSGFRGEASIRTFLARIAHNLGVDHVARQTARPRTVPLDPEVAWGGPAPDEDAEQGVRQARVLAAVQALPLAWRQPVVLTLEGFVPREIALVLGVSANVVSIRLTRAKEALRTMLQEPL